MPIDEEPMACDVEQSAQPGQAKSKYNLREMSIILDEWTRACDTTINTLSNEISKIYLASSNKK